MNIDRLIGFAAAILTTISFLPQAYHSLRTRDTHSISLSMYLLFTLGVALWLVYGLMIHDLPVMLANAVTLSIGADGVGAEIALWLNAVCHHSQA